MKEIDFKSGRTVYNEFNIDFDVPFSEQLDALTEDLLQVKYDKGYLLDLGWHSGYEVTGCVLVQLVKGGNWKQPLYKGKVNSYDELRSCIEEAVKMVNA